MGRGLICRGLILFQAWSSLLRMCLRFAAVQACERYGPYLGVNQNSFVRKFVCILCIFKNVVRILFQDLENFTAGCPSQPRAQPSRWQLSTEQTLHLTKTFQIFLIWGGFLQRKIKITLQTSLQNQDHMKTAVLKQGGLLPFCFANRTNPASLFFITGSSCHGKQGLCPFPKWMNELSAKLHLC